MTRHLVALLCLALLGPLGASALDLAAPGRPATDATRDALDHPAEVVALTGVKPGMRIADVFGGSGYWSELFAQEVGPQGQVRLHNNKAYLGFGEVSKGLEARLAGGRLANVVRHDREAGALDLAPASLDGALIMLTVHDFWLEEEGWDVTADKVLPQLRAALKPGAFLLVIDHRGNPDTGNSQVKSLHRIEEPFARKAIEGYGFRFEKASEVLRNAADDHTLIVFDPKVRGRTDRFVHLYRNPG
jgi:predicted methyltransferase